MTLDTALQQLRQAMSTVYEDRPEELEQLRPLCRMRHFAAGEHLHEAGQTASQVFFLCRGLVRFYYISEDGREHNKSFAAENQFAGALRAATQPKTVRYFIQALEDCDALAVPLDDLQKLYRQSLFWANIGRLSMEALASRKERREGAFLLDNAEQRYLDFLHEQPQLCERLPLYHIASYIGITDVALSRIRRRLKDR